MRGTPVLFAPTVNTCAGAKGVGEGGGGAGAPKEAPKQRTPIRFCGGRLLIDGFNLADDT